MTHEREAFLLEVVYTRQYEGILFPSLTGTDLADIGCGPSGDIGT